MPQGPNPQMIPPGYQPGAGDDWTCLAGFVGKARKVCPCGGEASILKRSKIVMFLLYNVMTLDET